MSDLIGKKVVAVRPMTDGEKDQNYWDDEFHTAPVIEFDDGTIVYPSRDEEGNGPGALFGETPEGKCFMFSIYNQM